MTHAQRQAAADRAAGLAQSSHALSAPGEAPHYFGPYPNYANSPLPTGIGGALGNPLSARAFATDYATPPGTLGPVFVVSPAVLPTGMLQSFEIWNQALPGQSPTPSAGNLFHAYVLRPTGTASQYLVVHDSGLLTVPVLPTGSAGQKETFEVGPLAVQAGDVIGFYGQGIPVDIGAGADLLSYPAPVVPAAGNTLTLGVDPDFPIHPQARTYSFGAIVSTGGIRKFVDGLPGLTPAGANNLGQYLPVAVADTTSYPGSDYYEIAIVQYRERMHSDLPSTLLRGYVQLETAVNVADSKHVALTTANLDGTTTPILLDGQPVFAVDAPHNLGPLISALKHRPVRILFRNLLPTGVEGNLFLPVDTTVMGSGMGPQMAGMPETDPQNPMCGTVPKPAGCFTENRATLHLHGGITPWISDGTPHQWITPADESTPYPTGVSVRNVPDMPDPGPGAQTFFYTNQQSARLMFYHDHSWGITRLNVYAGGAAAYLISDPTEQSLVTQGLLPADQIPLIIQDKTFVPGQAELEMEDPTWDPGRWGGFGNLWVPHVYVPAQHPDDSSGVNPFGRWAYGPWFWPPTSKIAHPPIPNPYFDPDCDSEVSWCEPPEIPGTPFVSMGMESFNDTPVVNGTAYPTTTVEPKAYRLRILNAANDRFWNLQFYLADSSGTEVALNPAEVAAALEDPTVFPTPQAGTAGPSWIQIGTEGGFLPAPTLIPNQPITWVNDPTVFNAGNVDKHSLLLGPAERADVVVDFSPYAGRTLILYNDAPAAFPARDPRYDYYTGNADLTETGGAPATLPGYGPNTRTVMQIRVSGTPSATPPPTNHYDPQRLAALQNAFQSTVLGGQGVFESSQNPILVGQAAYNSAYASSFRSRAPRDGFVRITNFSFTFNTLLGQDLTHTLTMPLQAKAIQDEMGEAFDAEYGRMSGNLGLETPGAQVGAQKFVLYPFVNPATEVLQGIELPAGVIDLSPISSADDGTQIWKITHNGVDTHPIHFHLYDVQLVNRVGWDGAIRAPDANELGWKETVRVSPLEDTIVALRPLIPKIPFGLPDSRRPLNPMMPLGSTAGFNNVDANGNPIQPPLTNEIVNFGWEYVWHCHILSHEEMDMMRPVSVAVSRALPAAPVLSATGAPGSPIDLLWTDGTPVDYSDPASWGDPANEVGFRVERAAGNGEFIPIATALANATRYTDDQATDPLVRYRVVAFNAAGDSASNQVTLGAQPPAAPTDLSVLLRASVAAGPRVRLRFVDRALTETGFVVERSTDGAAFAPIAHLGPLAGRGAVIWFDTTVLAGTRYQYRVYAVVGSTASQASNLAELTVPFAPAAPSGFAVAAQVTRLGTDRVTAVWTDNSDNESRFVIQRAADPAFTTDLTTRAVRADATFAGDPGLPRGATFYYRIQAQNPYGRSVWVEATPFPVITP